MIAQLAVPVEAARAMVPSDYEVVRLLWRNG